MRRALLVVLAGAVIVASIAAAQPLTRPSLHILKRHPLVINGASFKPFERVLLVLTVDESRSRRSVVATRRGAFTARFEGVRLGACTHATLVATGKGGEVVKLKIGLRECPGPVLDP